MTDQPTAPVPAPQQGLRPPAPEFTSRPRDEDRTTRKPLAWWDRVKFFILFVGAFMVLVWATMAQYSPIITFTDAFRTTLKGSWWLLLLAGLELLRQINYFIEEKSERYYRFWTHSVFGRWDNRVSRMDDWNRFRISRVLKILFWLVILDLVLAKIYNLSPAVAFFQVPVILYQAAPVIFQMILLVFVLILQFVALFWFLSRGGVDVYFPDDIKTRFSDVWGQDNVLHKVKENIVFLEDPESIESRGGYVPGGILLWGPPGTGKTLMAEAVAGETGKPYVFVDPGAFINMFMGVGILKVKSLFRRLRKLALRYGGVIAFFDEADALGNRGQISQGGPGSHMDGGSAFSWTPPCNGLAYLPADTASMLFHERLSTAVPDPQGPVRDRQFVGGMMGNQGGMGTLQALLTELSGLKKPRGFFNRVVRRSLGMRPKPPPKYRILIMMATNMPSALDEALLRPGRIDRIYKIGYPSKAGRIRTYEGYLSQVANRLTPDEVDRLATITPYATGATIKDMVNEALINAIRDGRDVIEWRDVIKAKQLKDLGPPEDVEYIERERHAVAVHEACHAVAAYRIRHHLTIDIATIEKGGTYLGMVASIPPEDQFTRWRSEYESDIVVSLASLAGERMFFQGDSSSGVSGDLESATMMATMMEGYWGMGSTVASHGVTHDVGIGGGGKPGGEGKEKELLEGTLGGRIEAKLDELLQRTQDLLEQNRREVLAVAHALETHKTVTGQDLEAVIEGRRGPLIDATWYGTNEFLEQAEAYHTDATRAHRDHSRPELPMPMPSAPTALNGDLEVNGERDPATAPAPPRPDVPEAQPEENGGQTQVEQGPGPKLTEPKTES